MINGLVKKFSKTDIFQYPVFVGVPNIAKHIGYIFVFVSACFFQKIGAVHEQIIHSPHSVIFWQRHDKTGGVFRGFLIY